MKLTVVAIVAAFVFAVAFVARPAHAATASADQKTSLKTPAGSVTLDNDKDKDKDDVKDSKDKDKRSKKNPKDDKDDKDDKDKDKDKDKGH